MTTNVASHLMIALDYSSVSQAEQFIAEMGRGPVWKIGYQLGYAGGLGLAKELAADGHEVFVDLKLHDIPNTVQKGVEALAELGVAWTTAHAYPQTLAAAVAGARGSSLKILGVTVLTSMNDLDLDAAGYRSGTSTLVPMRAKQALEADAAGIVTSAKEAALARAEVGDTLTIVTPGIRPANAALGDQKRVVTPGDAIRAGANRIVVGRPITQADNPKAAMAAILEEVTAALPG